MRSLFLAIAVLMAPASQAQTLSWEKSCTPFTDECLFLIASKEMHEASSPGKQAALYKLAYHSGRLGYDSIPSGDLEFAPPEAQKQAAEFLDLGRAVAAGKVSMNLNKPIKGLAGLLVAPDILPEALIDLSQADVLAILSASNLPASVKGLIIGRILVSELNEGEYRFVNGQIDEYVDFLEQLPHSFLALTSMAISLAEDGYTGEAQEIVKRSLIPKDYVRSQDVLLYLQALQAMFDGDNQAAISLASAIESSIFRLEALGHLYGMTMDTFLGKHYLSALYDLANPLTPVERRNIVLFTLSTMG